MSRHEFVQISPNLLAPALPELGKIKIGGKGEPRKKRGSDEVYYLPTKYSHFVVTTRIRDPRTKNFQRDEAIHKIIGETPTELNVRLLWDEPTENFRANLSAYNGKRRICSGNGETAIDVQHGPIACTCPLLKQHVGAYDGPARPQGATCKPHGKLFVVLDIGEVFGGYWVFRSTAWETTRNLGSQLSFFKEKFGYLAWLPLTLRLYPAEDVYEDKGETKTSTSYKVAFVMRASTEQAYKLARAAYETRIQLQLPASRELATIAAQRADVEDDDDAEEIAAEWHPETQPGFVDAEIVEDADEEDPLEETCRIAFELRGQTKLHTNEVLAKYAGRYAELSDLIDKAEPDVWKRAHEEYALRHQLQQEVAAAKTAEPAIVRGSGVEVLELFV